MTTDRDLLERLVPPDDDPWEHSGEGLDDCCHYCGEWRHDWHVSDTDRRYRYYHEPNCVWLEAMDYLGRGRETREAVHVPNTEYEAIQAAKPPRQPGPFSWILDEYAKAAVEQMSRSTLLFERLAGQDHD